MSREDCVGSTTLALKLGGSAPLSVPFRLAACVLGTGRNFVSTHSHDVPFAVRIVPPLITNKLSLLINYKVKLTGTSWEECVGSTIPALKLGGSTAPSSRPFRLAACVLGTGRKFCVDSC